MKWLPWLRHAGLGKWIITIIRSMISCRFLSKRCQQFHALVFSKKWSGIHASQTLASTRQSCDFASLSLSLSILMKCWVILQWTPETPLILVYYETFAANDNKLQASMSSYTHSIIYLQRLNTGKNICL